MIVDRYAMEHSSRSAEGVQAFEQAAFAVAAHRPGAADLLAAALRADAGCVAAHLLMGFAQVLLARAETMEKARLCLLEARKALAHRGGSLHEVVLAEALGLAVRGRGLAAADRIDDHIATGPAPLLPFKIAQALRFMGGDGRGMLVASHRALDAMTSDAPGYGFVLGCHAFNLEEAGEYRLAELAGRVAVEHEPLDAWGLHAVSHVHEMTGRSGDGIAWLEKTRPGWTGCNNFGHHVAWHLALFHLERGEIDRALDLYDREVRPSPSDDFRDMANAVSFLWRLRQHDIQVGERWAELRDMALRRRRDTTLLFASLHHLICLVATGERAAARELARVIAAGRGTRTDQAQVATFVAADLAFALARMGEATAAFVDPTALIGNMPRLGGSNAQRDIFVRMLAEMSAERGDGRLVHRVLALRRRLKAEDRFEQELMDRLDMREREGRRREVA